jgi:hypothetical protein
MALVNPAGQPIVPDASDRAIAAAQAPSCVRCGQKMVQDMTPLGEMLAECTWVAMDFWMMGFRCIKCTNERRDEAMKQQKGPTPMNRQQRRAINRDG